MSKHSGRGVKNGIGDLGAPIRFNSINLVLRDLKVALILFLALSSLTWPTKDLFFLFPRNLPRNKNVHGNESNPKLPSCCS